MDMATFQNTGRHRKAHSDTAFVDGFGFEDPPIQQQRNYPAHQAVYQGSSCGGSSTPASQQQQSPGFGVDGMELDEHHQQHGGRRPPFGRADAYDALQASPSTGHAGSRLSYQTSGGDPSDGGHGGDYNYGGGRAVDLQDQEAGSNGGQHELGMQRNGPGRDLGSYGPSSLSILDFAGPNAASTLRPVRRRAVSSSGLPEPGSNDDTPPSGEPSGRGRRTESARARKQPASQELQEASKAAKISANGRTERELVLLDPKRVRRIIANRQSAAKSKERKQHYHEQLEHALALAQEERDDLAEHTERAAAANDQLAQFVQRCGADAAKLAAHTAALLARNQQLMQELYAAQRARGHEPHTPASVSGAAAPSPSPRSPRIHAVADVPSLSELGLSDTDDTVLLAKAQAIAAVPMADLAIQPTFEHQMEATQQALLDNAVAAQLLQEQPDVAIAALAGQPLVMHHNIDASSAARAGAGHPGGGPAAGASAGHGHARSVGATAPGSTSAAVGLSVANRVPKPAAGLPPRPSSFTGGGGGHRSTQSADSAFFSQLQMPSFGLQQLAGDGGDGPHTRPHSRLLPPVSELSPGPSSSDPSFTVGGPTPTIPSLLGLSTLMVPAPELQLQQGGSGSLPFVRRQVTTSVREPEGMSVPGWRL